MNMQNIYQWLNAKWFNYISNALELNLFCNEPSICNNNIYFIFAIKIHHMNRQMYIQFLEEAE